MDNKTNNDKYEKKINVFKLFQRILSLLSWFFIVLAMVVSAGTIFNSYGIIQFRYFNNYLILELTLLLGFLLWGIKLYFYSFKYPSYKNYSIVSFIFGFIQLLFLVNNVY